MEGENMKTDRQYGDILRRILWSGTEEVNKRTGMKCMSLPGVTFQVDLRTDFPLINLRKIPIKNFIAEQMFFLSGGNSTQWLSTKTKIWDSFLEADGKLTAAYGHRWRHHFKEAGHPINQIEVVLTKLKVDSSDRHGVVMMWDPSTDLLVKQKNVPCPFSFSLMIIGGRLHLHLIVRSNDMVLGFPTDAAGFALLQLILAQELGVEPGIYTHSISNAHIYEDHYDAAATMARRVYADIGEPEIFRSVKIGLPEKAYRKAIDLDEGLYMDLIASVEAQYRPLEAITGLKLSV